MQKSLHTHASTNKMMMAEAFFELLMQRRVEIEGDPYAINIGCGDGVEFNDPVLPLYRKGYRGVAIDAWHHEGLEKNLGHLDVVLRPGTPLTVDNVVAILQDAGCPPNPHFLKIDIDGVDADILRSILDGGITPRVIQAEVNTEIPPPFAFAVNASEAYKGGSEHGFFGFSLTYGDDLLKQFGYEFVELDFETPWTHDALWVQADLLERAGLDAGNAEGAFFQRGAHLYHIETTSKDMLASWRERRDLSTVRSEIWKTMLDACRVKLGHIDAPFELYISKGRSPQS